MDMVVNFVSLIYSNVSFLECSCRLQQVDKQFCLYNIKSEYHFRDNEDICNNDTIKCDLRIYKIIKE